MTSVAEPTNTSQGGAGAGAGQAPGAAALPDQRHPAGLPPFETEQWEARRERLLAAIPPSFSGVRHVALLGGISLALIAGSLALLRDLRASELLVVPLAFLFANLVEWLIHKYPLHAPIPPPILYKRHTLTHHVVFTHETMGVRSWNELYLVMFPIWALPTFAFLALPGPVALLWWAWSRNAALLLSATAVAYYVLYEVCHLSYHLPDGHPISRSALVQRLKRHHQGHHDPRRMVEGNFNITFPICDWVLGSTLRDRDEEPRRETPPREHAEVEVGTEAAGERA